VAEGALDAEGAVEGALDADAEAAGGASGGVSGFLSHAAAAHAAATTKANANTDCGGVAGEGSPVRCGCIRRSLRRNAPKS
jgi:hypothetical protein